MMKLQDNATTTSTTLTVKELLHGQDVLSAGPLQLLKDVHARIAEWVLGFPGVEENHRHQVVGLGNGLPHHGGNDGLQVVGGSVWWRGCGVHVIQLIMHLLVS